MTNIISPNFRAKDDQHAICLIEDVLDIVEDNLERATLSASEIEAVLLVIVLYMISASTDDVQDFKSQAEMVARSVRSIAKNWHTKSVDRH